MTDPSPFAILEQSAAAAQRGQVRPVPKRTVNALRRGAALLASACKRHTPPATEKLLFYGGLAHIVLGCWMIYHPLGPLVGGGIAVWLGMLVSVEREAK